MKEFVETTLTVNLGERSYPIHVGADLAARLRSELRLLQVEGRKIAILTDSHVFASQRDFFLEAFDGLPTHAVAPGEDSKSLTVLGSVLDHLADRGLDRGSLLVVVGGGVVGDLGGFAASCWLRGIAFIQVPTTLLAMVDSSVGGKTGINLKAGKNLVGAFHQPKSVYISIEVLRTLPPREFAAGMAEVIKYGLLGDEALFRRLEKEPLTLESQDLPAVIQRCCEIKAGIVAADERELAREGGRALLNLGHTFGHAIEQVAGYGTYLHGEAVAIGLCAAARLSQELGFLNEAEVSRVDAVVKAHGLPVCLRAPLAFERLQAAMAKDKKVRAGALRFVVLKSLGNAFTQGDVPPALAEKCFRALGAA